MYIQPRVWWINYEMQNPYAGSGGILLLSLENVNNGKIEVICIRLDIPPESRPAYNFAYLYPLQQDVFIPLKALP